MTRNFTITVEILGDAEDFGDGNPSELPSLEAMQSVVDFSPIRDALSEAVAVTLCDVGRITVTGMEDY